jgi:hypothetical protein
MDDRNNMGRNLFNGSRVSLGVSKKLKPFMCFDYVTIYHIKMKGTEFNVKNIKNFRIEWRKS